MYTWKCYIRERYLRERWWRRFWFLEWKKEFGFRRLRDVALHHLRDHVLLVLAMHAHPLLVLFAKGIGQEEIGLAGVAFFDHPTPTAFVATLGTQPFLNATPSIANGADRATIVKARAYVAPVGAVLFHAGVQKSVLLRGPGLHVLVQASTHVLCACLFLWSLVFRPWFFVGVWLVVLVTCLQESCFLNYVRCQQIECRVVDGVRHDPNASARDEAAKHQSVEQHTVLLRPQQTNNINITLFVQPVLGQ